MCIFLETLFIIYFYINRSLLEKYDDELNTDPNNPDIVFNKITVLNELGREDELIHSTKKLIESQKTLNNENIMSTSEEEGSNQKFHVYHNSPKKTILETIKDTIWNDYSIFDPLELTSIYERKKIN